MSYLDSKFSSSDRTRLAQSVWHDLVLAVSQAVRIFDESGYAREATCLSAHIALFSRHAEQHLERLLGENWHSKGSGSASTHQEADAEAPVESSQAPADEEGASEGGGHVALVESRAPCSDGCDESSVRIRLELIIQTRIDELGDEMAKRPDAQELEVALKMMHRARSYWRDGRDDKGRPMKREHKEQVVWKLLKAAANARGEAKEVAL